MRSFFHVFLIVLCTVSLHCLEKYNSLFRNVLKYHVFCAFTSFMLRKQLLQTYVKNTSSLTRCRKSVDMEKMLIIIYPEEGWLHLSCPLHMEILHSVLSHSPFFLKKKRQFKVKNQEIQKWLKFTPSCCIRWLINLVA